MSKAGQALDSREQWGLWQSGKRASLSKGVPLRLSSGPVQPSGNKDPGWPDRIVQEKLETQIFMSNIPILHEGN